MFRDLKNDLRWNMEGLPSAVLSAIMLALAVLIAWFAIKAPTHVKAIILAWIVLP
jgi:hypothetical protein